MDHTLCVYGTIEREMRPQLESGKQNDKFLFGDKGGVVRMIFYLHI